MTLAQRTATTTWTGGLAHGSGEIRPDSAAFASLPVTWASRVQQPGGKTSPEELAAAAHSSCFAMALSLRIGELQLEPEELIVSARVTLAEVEGRPTVTSSELHVQARVPGIDRRAFEQAVEEAAGLCPISRLFAGAKISVNAQLAETVAQSKSS